MNKSIFVAVLVLVCLPCSASPVSSTLSGSSNHKTSVYVGNQPQIQLPDVNVKLNIDNNKGIGASEILASLALLVSVLTFIYSIYQNKKSKRSSIKETFWMREVLIPKFLNRFLQFIDDAPQCYLSANDLGDFYNTYALHELNQLKDSAILLEAGSDGLGVAILSLFENFEDDVMEVSDVLDLSKLLVDLAKFVINQIQSAQEQLG